MCINNGLSKVDNYLSKVDGVDLTQAEARMLKKLKKGIITKAHPTFFFFITPKPRVDVAYWKTGWCAGVPRS